MRVPALAAALAMLTLAASAPVASRDRPRRSDAERLDAELAGLVPDKAVECINLRESPRTARFGRTLVYIYGSRLKYRNETGGGCDSSGLDDDVLVTRTPSTQLCRGDIAQAVDRSTGMNVGGCSLGAFVPYRRP